MAGLDLKEEEGHTIAFHELSVKDAADIWRDGINALLRGFDPIAGKKVQRDEDVVLLALLMRAWQTVACAYDLALRGYYPQALNLLRTPIEDWLAYWYLRSFPSDWRRFTDLPQTTPKFNEMLQAIESKRTFQDPVARSWIRRLHQFSHVDRSGVRMVILPGQGQVSLALGPQQNELLFRYCTSEALGIVGALLEAVDNVRQLAGCDQLPGLEELAQRIEAWQKAQARAAP